MSRSGQFTGKVPRWKFTLRKSESPNSVVLVLNLAEKENKSKMAALVTGSTDFEQDGGRSNFLAFFGLSVAVLFFQTTKGGRGGS